MYFLKCLDLQILAAEGNCSLTQLSILAVTERKECVANWSLLATMGNPLFLML